MKYLLALLIVTFVVAVIYRHFHPVYTPGMIRANRIDAAIESFRTRRLLEAAPECSVAAFIPSRP